MTLPLSHALSVFLDTTLSHQDSIGKGSIVKIGERANAQPTLTALFKPDSFVLLVQAGGELHEWPYQKSGHESLALINAVPKVFETAQNLHAALLAYQSLKNQCAVREANLLFVRFHMTKDKNNTEISGALCGQGLVLESATPTPHREWKTALIHREPLLQKTSQDTGSLLWHVESGKGPNTKFSKVKADTPEAAVDIHYALGHKHSLEDYPYEPIRIFKEYTDHAFA